MSTTLKQRIDAARARAEAARTSATAILESASENGETRDLTADEQAAFDAEMLKAESANVEAKNAERLLAAATLGAKPSDTPTGDAPNIVASERSMFGGKIITRRDAKSNFGAYLRCMAAGEGNLDRAATFAEKAYGPESQVFATLTTNDQDAGGSLVPERVSEDIIEPLRAASVVRRFGPTTLNNDTGVMHLPRITSGANGQWVGEATANNAEDPTTDDIVLTWKKCQAKVPMSKELVLTGGSGVEMKFLNDSVRGIANTEDQAFLRGNGTQHSPKGMRYWALAANITATNGTTASQVEQDFRELIEALEGNNVTLSEETGVFMMCSRTKNFLSTLRDSNGNLIYPEMREAQPRIHSYRVGITNNIPKNLGGGTESEIYFAHMPDLVIGETTSMETEVLTDVAYTNSSGTLVSTTDRDEILLKVTNRVDFAVQYAEAIAVKTGITYGA